MNEEGALNWKQVLLRFNGIAAKRPQQADILKSYLLRAPHELCPIAVQVALEDGEAKKNTVGDILAEVLKELRDPVLAERIYDLIPERTLALGRASVEATRQCLLHLGRTGETALDCGSLSNNLAVRLAGIGDYAGALEAARRAVRFYRKQTKADSAMFMPFLAMALNTLSVREADCGRLRPALATAKEAVKLCERLERVKPGGHTADMALALMTLANRHSALGDGDEALRIGRRAQEIYGQLAKGDPRHKKDFALSLHNFASRLTEQGRHVEALPFGETALRMFQELASGASDEYEELVASAQNVNGG